MRFVVRVKLHLAFAGMLDDLEICIKQMHQFELLHNMGFRICACRLHLIYLITRPELGEWAYLCAQHTVCSACIPVRGVSCWSLFIHQSQVP